MSYPSTMVQRWKAPSAVRLTGLATGSGTIAWRLWTSLPIVPILHPVISFSSDSGGSTWLARDLQWADMKQAVTCCFQTLDSDFFCARIQVLLPWWDKCLSVSGDCMAIWCAPFATHVPCIHEVKIKFLASEWLCYILKLLCSWVWKKLLHTIKQFHLSLCKCS
jgi:hypothetical protein